MVVTCDVGGPSKHYVFEEKQRYDFDALVDFLGQAITLTTF
jgi:hypothetical protein